MNEVFLNMDIIMLNNEKCFVLSRTAGLAAEDARVVRETLLAGAEQAAHRPAHHRPDGTDTQVRVDLHTIDLMALIRR